MPKTLAARCEAFPLPRSRSRIMGMGAGFQATRAARLKSEVVVRMFSRRCEHNAWVLPKEDNTTRRARDHFTQAIVGDLFFVQCAIG